MNKEIFCEKLRVPNNKKEVVFEATETTKSLGQLE